MKIALVNCRLWPGFSPSDTCYAAALRAHGATVEAVAWNDDDKDSITSFDAAVLRRNWDSHEDVTAFTAWMERVEQAGVRLFNPRKLVVKYMDKRALKPLAAMGIPMPVSHEVEANEGTIAGIMHRENWQNAVLKPAFGAGGSDVEKVEIGNIGAALASIGTGGRSGPRLLQEFMPEIAQGEIQLVYLGGTFSHAVKRMPVPGEFRTNSKFDSISALFEPDPAIVAAGDKVLAVLTPAPLYARIDGVMRGNRFYLNEVEVNEPGLWLDIAPPAAAENFAIATLALLEQSPCN